MNVNHAICFSSNSTCSDLVVESFDCAHDRHPALGVVPGD